MKNVGFYDWQLDSTRPVSWMMVSNPAHSGGKTYDMHRALHLGIILSGMHKGRYGNTEFALSTSNIFLTAPWEPHCTIATSHDRKILLINLDDATLENFFFAGREKLANLFAMPPVERMQCINQVPGKELWLEKMLAVCRAPEAPEKILRVYNAVLEFFINLLPTIPDRDVALDLLHSRLRPALQNLSCRIMGVEQAAGLCNLSSSRFSVLFKQVSGMSFGRYERLFRLNGARDDLQRGATLKETALKWSFCDKSHLARLLKQYW